MRKRTFFAATLDNYNFLIYNGLARRNKKYEKVI